MMAIINEIKIGCAANRSLSLADGGERAFPTKDPHSFQGFARCSRRTYPRVARRKMSLLRGY
jgi:hypothetical protein